MKLEVNTPQKLIVMAANSLSIAKWKQILKKEKRSRRLRIIKILIKLTSNRNWIITADKYFI